MVKNGAPPNIKKSCSKKKYLHLQLGSGNNCWSGIPLATIARYYDITPLKGFTHALASNTSNDNHRPKDDFQQNYDKYKYIKNINFHLYLSLFYYMLTLTIKLNFILSDIF